MLLRLLLPCFLLLHIICEAKPPALTPRDTRIKVEEILRAHVTYQSLTPELIRRALVNYIDELDPGKTYFIESDILKWTSPSPELLVMALEGFKKEDFSAFEEIHEKMIEVIKRRNSLEIKIDTAKLPKNVQTSEFKDLKWTQNTEELLTRLVRIKALQLEAASKLNQETQAQFAQRLSKRRFNREDELVAHSQAEQKQLVLSYVLKATSSALDSQTAYFTPAEANQFMIQVQQRLFGIGAQLRDDLNGFTIVRLLEGGPASMGNQLKAGDRIIAVENEPVVGMEITEAVELIRGQQGTNVLLTILRNVGTEENKREEKLDINIIRGEVVLKESRLETTYEPYGDGVVGILKLFSFYQDSNSSSTSDLQLAIDSLKKEHNLKGIILDLRNNGGGLLPQAVSVTGLFISKGVVVSVKDNSGAVQHLRNIDGKMAWDGPLVVLISRASASAAEIVAQTLQDYGRAILVGDKQSYGKGTFQTFTLESAHFGKVNPKGEYKVTRGRYYTVSGKSPQLVGVQSDIVCPGLYSQLDIGEKFAKFPLENDQIAASFEDDLTDVPALHRHQIMKLYKVNLQPILTTYTSFLEVLRKNSEQRISLNPNYQNFLKEINQKDHLAESVENFGQSDLQLNEAMNVMKDLVLLMKIKAEKS